ncbi:MAG: helix-turn-helix transcriptional regulator [Geodermatophilaceae bacterium]|nr:helix-turn-helix transcriptional regulator [Geodermatophilaceae bacterium]
MTDTARLRAAARAAHQNRAWRQAAEALRAVDADDGLTPEELTLLAEAAYLSGDPAGCVTAHERAFAMHAASGESHSAARSAFWAGLILASSGGQSAAGGWLARAMRTLDECGDGDCVERGYLLIPLARAHYAAGRFTGTEEAAGRAADTGRRHGDRDLVAFAAHSQGRALLRLERLDEGLALIDEVFVETFPNGLTSSVLTGIVACSVVDGCQQVGAFDRAQEWTAALSAWCDEQPELAQFSAECLVHRAEVLLRRGRWQDSLLEARAAARLAEEGALRGPAAAAAYRRGEALRLLGRSDEAEAAFRAARSGGYDPAAGLARLQWGLNRAQAARATVRRALAVTDDPIRRAEFLPAAIEVMVGAGELSEAASGAAELAEIAKRWPTTGLRAPALHAGGSVALAAGEAAPAAASLREAWSLWSAQPAPFEAAQARLLLARACSALGDEEAAKEEEQAALAVLTALHAQDKEPAQPAALSAGAAQVGLTAREAQVLGLLTTGLRNRAIAERLVLSERTVDRHVSNILGKLGVPTRTAATAFAFAHGLS